jgi:glycosyltransferase involved in cell wall biosynthesis
LIDKLGVRSQTFIVGGYVPNPDIRKYFSVADLVVFPYVTATQSGPIQLAYLFEKPMIATNVGGLKDAVSEGKTGYLVPPQDAKAIAHAALKFFREKPDFSPGLRAYKEKYTWTYYAEVVESFLSEATLREEPKKDNEPPAPRIHDTRR